MSRPLRFESLDREFNVGPGTVTEWSKMPEFPLAGEGVAFVEPVREWAVKHKILVVPSTEPAASFDALEAVKEAVSPILETIDQDDEPEVDWVTIRVPVVRSPRPHVGNRPLQTFRVSSREPEVREGMALIIAGCRLSHVQRVSGRHCDTMSDAVKWLFEEIQTAVARESGM